MNGKIQELITRFPLLLPTAEKLNQAGLTWMIGGSGCLFVLGNRRVPDDIDIYLLDEEHDVADKLFGIESYTYSSPTESVRNSNPQGDHSMQLTSHLTFMLDKSYQFSITPLVVSKRIEIEHEGHRFYLLSPEDVLLVKALLQRGKDVGKQDVEDVQDFMAIYNIDRAYLSERVKELGAEARVGALFDA